MKTKITKIEADWTDVKNKCRTTVNKQATDVPATKDFIKKVLISEHSPIRLVHVHFSWTGIKSWISVHFARHWLGWDKFISTQRHDRTGVDRDKSPQDTLVNMDVCSNSQALINVGRWRLCRQASDGTREYAEDLKVSLYKAGQTELSDVMVPNCIYRGGCPEFQACQYNIWARFLAYCKENNLQINTIQRRYDAYHKFFYDYEKHHKDL